MNHSKSKTITEFFVSHDTPIIPYSLAKSKVPNNIFYSHFVNLNLQRCNRTVYKPKRSYTTVKMFVTTVDFGWNRIFVLCILLYCKNTRIFVYYCKFREKFEV